MELILENMCDNIPNGRPPLSQPPKSLMAIRLSSGFSHLRQGYFTFLYKHIEDNIHNREVEEKKNKQARTWVSSKRKKGEVCDTFV